MSGVVVVVVVVMCFVALELSAIMMVILRYLSVYLRVEFLAIEPPEKTMNLL